MLSKKIGDEISMESNNPQATIPRWPKIEVITRKRSMKKICKSDSNDNDNDEDDILYNVIVK